MLQLYVIFFVDKVVFHYKDEVIFLSVLFKNVSFVRRD